MIQITSKQEGFRRCGVAFSCEATEFPDKAFSKEQLEILQNEPMLTVIPVASDEKKDAKKEEKKTDKK